MIISQLQGVVEKIIEDYPRLEISARARAGAEISDWVEEKFVEYTREHRYFHSSESAPKGSTKNPWDARTRFRLENNVDEEVWIDFKAFKMSSANSNPDIGTPRKIISLISGGNFYLVFIYLFYEADGNGLKFVKLNDSFTKLYFLKDISSTFRRNPKNQLQVNVSADPEYRTREEFIRLLMVKIKESHLRQIEISKNALDELDEVTAGLLEANKKSEEELTKKI